LKIYVKNFWVGNGAFNAFENSTAEFEGSYNFLGNSGTFAIAIKLTDNKPKNKSGGCEITLNGETDSGAKYRVRDQKLTLTTKLNNKAIDVYPSQGGTQIDGVSGHDVWIGHWGG
jgi:hypothetical protein